MRTLPFLVALAAMTDLAAAADPRPMTTADLFKFKRVADPQLSPDGQWVVYEVTEITDPDENKKHTNLWLAATDGQTPPRQLTSSGKRDAHARWSPDGTKILFESTRGGTGQLYVLDMKHGGEAKPITEISTGAGTGIWSRDGKHIAFVSAVYPEFSTLPFAESDKKNKEKEAAAESSKVKAKVFTKLFYRHWDEYVGDKRQHLFVVAADGIGCHDATPGDRDAYPTSTTFGTGDDFTFTPDGQHLVFTAVPAKNESWSTNYDLCRVSIRNDKAEWETLTKDNPAADGCPRFSPDGKTLAWRAQKKAGYEADPWHVVTAAANPDGTLTGPPKNRTAGARSVVPAGTFNGGRGPAGEPFDGSIDEFAWKDDATLYAVIESWGNKQVHTIPLGERDRVVLAERLVAGSAGSLSVSRDGKLFTFALARMFHPAEVVRLPATFPAKGEPWEPLNLSRANDAHRAGLALGKPEAVVVPVEGGATMQMWVLKPPGFDAAKKWPVVYLVHGGPQGAWEDAWSFRWNPQLWAAQGYVVVLPNPRGSTGFGQKFVDEISGDWGGKCYRDLVAGVEYLKKQPYIDANRMGSAGGSFGGYMQNWFAVNDVAKEFKCLMTHCSVWNFESMWGTTDELWFDEYEHGGLPWEIPGKYREFSPHAKAGNLGKYKVPMLILHNDLDFRCPIGQGHELFSALQRQGVPSRFVNFPDEGHWVLKPANSQFWHDEVFGWLKKYVPPGGK